MPCRQQQTFFHWAMVSGRYPVTPAPLHRPTGSRVTGINESSVDNVVDLAVTRLPASYVSAREAMISE